VIALIGVGNILLRDEGVGVHVINAIKRRYTFSSDVEIVDGGTMGLDLLPIIEGKDKVLIVDAVDFGEKPGYIGMIEKDDIPSVLNTKLSVHHINLSDVFFALKLMGTYPSEICLIGIQPQSIDVGLNMTDEINDKVDELIEKAVTRLKKWGVLCYKNQDSVKA
jgi:hydrogenase maturation protease